MKSIFLSFFLLFSFGFSYAQSSGDDVIRAIKSGNSSEIARHFDKVIDITINNEQSTYSKSQGEMVLKKFFNNHPVTSFSSKHKGSPADNNSIFIIGDLSTKDNKMYRVYLYFKLKSNVFLLQEMRFEE